MHTTLAEVEYNRETGKLEVALRIPALELEQALTIFSGRGRVSLDADDSVIDPILHQYLTAHISIVADDVSLPIEWVGKEIEATRAWLYFEVPLPTAHQDRGMHDLEIRNRVLTELQEVPLNSLALRQGSFRQFLRSTVESESIEIPEALRRGSFRPQAAGDDELSTLRAELEPWQDAWDQGSPPFAADGLRVIAMGHGPPHSSLRQWQHAQKLTLTCLAAPSAIAPESSAKCCIGLLVSPESAAHLNAFLSGEVAADALPALFTPVVSHDLAGWYTQPFLDWLVQLREQFPTVRFVGLEQHLPPLAGDGPLQSRAQQLRRELRRRQPEIATQCAEWLDPLRKLPELGAAVRRIADDQHPHLIDHIDTLLERLNAEVFAGRERLVELTRQLRKCAAVYRGEFRTGAARLEHLSANISWYLRRDPQLRMILWAPSALIARCGAGDEEVSLGALLTEQWGLQYWSVGYLPVHEPSREPPNADPDPCAHGWSETLGRAFGTPLAVPQWRACQGLTSAARSSQGWQLPRPLRLRSLTPDGEDHAVWRQVPLSAAYDGVIVLEHGGSVERLDR